jgi:hypothetical protein
MTRSLPQEKLLREVLYRPPPAYKRIRGRRVLPMPAPRRATMPSAGFTALLKITSMSLQTPEAGGEKAMAKLSYWPRGMTTGNPVGCASRKALPSTNEAPVMTRLAQPLAMGGKETHTSSWAVRPAGRLPKSMLRRETAMRTSHAGVTVGVDVGPRVAVAVGVAVLVAVGVGVGVLVGVSTGVPAVGVGVQVMVGVAVQVGVAVAVGV